MIISARANEERGISRGGKEEGRGKGLKRKKKEPPSCIMQMNPLPRVLIKCMQGKHVLKRAQARKAKPKRRNIILKHSALSWKQSKETTYQMGENIFRLSGIKFQNVRRLNSNKTNNPI